MQLYVSANIKEEIDNLIDECKLACNLWLEEYGFSSRVDSNGYWGYCPADDTIEIQIYEESEDVAAWNDFLYDHLHCISFYDIFITSFLHELGHAHTLEFFDEHDWEVARSALTPRDYFETPIEIAATHWAIDFMDNQKEEVDMLAELLRPAIEKIELI